MAMVKVEVGECRLEFAVVLGLGLPVVGNWFLVAEVSALPAVVEACTPADVVVATVEGFVVV
jgi:hypothetical protein